MRTTKRCEFDTDAVKHGLGGVAVVSLLYLLFYLLFRS